MGLFQSLQRSSYLLDKNFLNPGPQSDRRALGGPPAAETARADEEAPAHSADSSPSVAVDLNETLRGLDESHVTDPRVPPRPLVRPSP